MASYGQEWVIDEEPIPKEIVPVTRDLILQRYPGSIITHTLVVGFSEDQHAWLKCRSKRAHTHIMLKWVDDVE